MIAIHIESGCDVMEELTVQLEQRGIQHGAIVSIVGAVDEYCISNMPKADARRDILTEFTEPAEMSGAGEVQDGRPHLHCVFGREDNSTVSGHLHSARVKNWFVHVYVIPMSN